MSKQSNHVMIRVPIAVKERLDRIAAEMMESYERGNGYSDVEITEQGSRGMWVPIHSAITRVLNDWEDARRRANRKNRPKRQRTTKAS